MPITREQVRHIALLARLDLSEEEEASFTDQLDHILTHFERLQHLATEQIEPTAHIVEMETPYREDAVLNAPAAEDVLSQAPAREGNFFKVPKIID